VRIGRHGRRQQRVQIALSGGDAPQLGALLLEKEVEVRSIGLRTLADVFEEHLVEQSGRALVMEPCKQHERNQGHQQQRRQEAPTEGAKLGDDATGDRHGHSYTPGS
jgi:hypothetical protein